jgi:carbonic anhydrase/acetyltransferase-like protein (isoleucine patch superfamily)
MSGVPLRRRLLASRVRAHRASRQRPAGRSLRFCRAPTAVLGGGAHGATGPVLSAAVLSAGDGRLSVGASSAMIEDAAIRRARQFAVIGDDVPAGPQAHVNGARVGGRLSALTGNR